MNFPFVEFTFSFGLGPLTPSGYETWPKSSIILAAAKVGRGIATTFFVVTENLRGWGRVFGMEVLRDEFSSKYPSGA